ncbi:MAG: type III PLP-dependent enzyme [Ilumatobacteraceae bacterium]|nr:type III PLP-dependent enzyme [Ilumatobacteraceae bacterium]
MNERTAALVARCFPGSSDQLVLDGVSASDLVREFGSPIYAYSAAGLERSWLALRNALPNEIDICYSIKANPHPAVVERLVSFGARLEIASAGELNTVIAAGGDPAKTLFAGPGKAPEELAAAIDHGIAEIHVESLLEAERLSALATERGVTTRVAVRVNPDSEAQGGAMRMGGQPAPFGVDEEELDHVVAALEKLPGIELVGVHLFAGTQILSADVLIAQYRKAIEVAVRVGDLIGRPLSTVDFGGGLGIPYFDRDRQLDLEALRVGVTALMADRPAALAETQFLVEPGRFLAGEAGVYLATVRDVKQSRGSTFVIIDGGMHHHLAASGNLGQVIKRNYPIVAADHLLAADAPPAQLVGPLCTPLDTLARDLTIPEVQPGDVIAVLQSGAYGRSASPMGFLSHPGPAEVWVEGGTARLIRSAGTGHDGLAGVIAP